MKKIILGHGKAKKLADALETTSSSVSRALNYRNNTLAAKYIRIKALEMGGIKVEDK